MLDRRSMLFVKSGSDDILLELSSHAFIGLCCNVVAEVFGPVDIPQVIDRLESGDAVYVDCLETLGRTQERVSEVLEKLILQHAIRVFVLCDEMRGVIEIDLAVLYMIQAFRRLDVVLVKRAA